MTLSPASSCTQTPDPVPSCRLRLNGTNAEQNLLSDLVTESIDIYGQSVYYIPRTLVKEDTIFTEDAMSSFNGAYEIRAYCNTVDGWEGQGDLLSKFGIRIEDKTTFVVSRRRFTEAVDDNAQLIVEGRPNEGDLIWAPFSSDLYQITFIEHEKPFYQLGKGYVWEMKCELFQYSHEDLNTGIDDVDEIEQEDSYTVDLVFTNVAGSGIFEVGEIVTGSNSDATGEVVSWNPTTRTLTLNNLTGNFEDTEVVTGEDSGATWTISQLNTLGMIEIEGAQNRYFEMEGNLIIDFSETNPFGEYGSYVEAGDQISALNQINVDSNIPDGDNLVVTYDSTTRKFKFADADEVLIAATDSTGTVNQDGLPDAFINAQEQVIETIVEEAIDDVTLDGGGF